MGYNYGTYGIYVKEIWNIADFVRGVINASEYNRVVLSFTMLHKLECALEPADRRLQISDTV